MIWIPVTPELPRPGTLLRWPITRACPPDYSVARVIASSSSGTITYECLSSGRITVTDYPWQSFVTADGVQRAMPLCPKETL